MNIKMNTKCVMLVVFIILMVHFRNLESNFGTTSQLTLIGVLVDYS